MLNTTDLTTIVQTTRNNENQRKTTENKGKTGVSPPKTWFYSTHFLPKFFFNPSFSIRVNHIKWNHSRATHFLHFLRLLMSDRGTDISGLERLAG
jgi:hypothetical protein